MQRFLRQITTFLLLASFTQLHGGSLLAAEAEPAISLEQVAKPFFAAHCITCQGEKKYEGDVRLHNLDPAILGGEDAELWGKVVEVLKLGQMPPEDQPQPQPQDVDRTTSWIQLQLAAVWRESDIEHKLGQPAYANLINHEKLFDGTAKGPSFSSARLWRLHPETYDNILIGFGREFGMGGPLSKPFTVGDGNGRVSNHAGLMQADSPTLIAADKTFIDNDRSFKALVIELMSSIALILR